MINEEKVKHMTKAAAYENGPEKKNIGISSYFRGDYLGLQLLKSGIAYTLAFLILGVMWAMGRIEELMLMISRPEYLEGLLKGAAFLYLAGMAVYEIAVYTYYTQKYHHAKQSVKGFHDHLKKIHRFYEIQETADTIREISMDPKADEEKRL